LSAHPTLGLTQKEIGEVRVLVIGDFRMVIDAIACGLSSLPDIDVVGCVVTETAEAIAATSGPAAEVIVADLDRMTCSAVEALEHVAVVGPAARVLALTGRADITRLRAAGAAGRVTWLDRTRPLSSLVERLRE
jgi:DNA-binding NarL/FixJ family response regulator